MTTGTGEKGLEDLICAALTGSPAGPQPTGAIGHWSLAYGAGGISGSPQTTAEKARGSQRGLCKVSLGYCMILGREPEDGRAPGSPGCRNTPDNQTGPPAASGLLA